jgi:methylated-DNA-[protein]-cysteine S-methyltransferase
MWFRLVETPIGECAIIFKEEQTKVKVIHILLPISPIEKRVRDRFPDVVEGEHQKILELENEIQNYFAGAKRRISMALLDTSLCYPFQLKVLKTERTIPHGKTASYGWVARQIGTRAHRAVGNALARNPFPIVVPCHRAVRSDRTLGGFQGGLEMKRKLLELEGVEFDSNSRVSLKCFMK